MLLSIRLMFLKTISQFQDKRVTLNTINICTSQTTVYTPVSPTPQWIISPGYCSFTLITAAVIVKTVLSSS